jgi:hypothetical protein
VMDFRRLSELTVNAVRTSARELPHDPGVSSLVLSGMIDGAQLVVFPSARRDMPTYRSSGASHFELLDKQGRVLHASRFEFNATGTHDMRTFLAWVPIASLNGDAATIRITANGQRRSFPLMSSR